MSGRATPSEVTPTTYQMIVQLSVHCRRHGKVVKHLATLEEKYQVVWKPLLLPTTASTTASSSSTTTDEAVSSSSTSYNSDWIILIAPSREKLDSAIRFYPRITGGHFKYENVRIYFQHNGKKKAMASIGVKDSSWYGPVVPFGAPILDSKRVYEHLFGKPSTVTIAGVSIASTSFQVSADGVPHMASSAPGSAAGFVRDNYFGSPALYPHFDIVLDVHLTSDAPRSAQERALRPMIQPAERPGLGLKSPCTATDLVIFFVASKFAPTPALSQPGQEASTSSSPPVQQQQHQVLIILEKSRKWFTPAGHIERGQSFPDAVKAEVEEESGYSLDTNRPLVPYDLVYGGRGYDEYSSFSIAPLHILYAGGIDETKPPIPAVDGLGVAWVPLRWILRQVRRAFRRDRVSSIEAKDEDEYDASFSLPNWGNEEGTEPAPFRKPWEMWQVLSRYAKVFDPEIYTQECL